MNKGTSGYIQAYKKRYGILSICFALAIILSFCIVISITKTVNHVAIVIPILLALPFAKLLLDYIIVARFSTISKEEAEQVEQEVQDRRNCNCLFDLAISSYESISFASVAVIDQGNIYLVFAGSNDKTYNQDKQREYIQQIIYKTGYDGQVYSVKDIKELLERIKQAPVAEEDLTVKINRLTNRLLDVCV